MNIIIKERQILKGKFERKDPNILKFKLKKKNTGREETQSPNPIPEYLGWVSFLPAKLDFYWVKVRMGVNLTRTNLIPA